MAVFIPSTPAHIAQANPIFGIALTKEQKYEKSLAKEQKYKTEYQKCRARRIKKGKDYWAPEETADGGGPTVKGLDSCKSPGKKYYKWLEKKQGRATKVKDKLKKKGKLTPELERELDSIERDPERGSSMSRPISAEGKQLLREAEEEFLDEDLMAEEAEEAAAAQTTTLVLGVIGLAVLGGAGYFFFLRK